MCIYIYIYHVSLSSLRFECKRLVCPCLPKLAWGGSLIFSINITISVVISGVVVSALISVLLFVLVLVFVLVYYCISIVNIIHELISMLFLGQELLWLFTLALLLVGVFVMVLVLPLVLLFVFAVVLRCICIYKANSMDDVSLL